MRNMLAVTTAAAALMFAAGTAFAQDTTSNTGGGTTTDNMYVTGEGENMRVMGGDNAEGVVILRGENFAEPEDCPEGSYYMSGDNQITACGEGGATFEVVAPGEGETVEGMPQGAMMMRPRESGESKQSDSGNQGDDGDQGDDASGNQGEGNTQSESGGDAGETQQ